MEATDLAETIRESLVEGNEHFLATEAGYEETDFFVTAGGERFLVAVMKVSE